MSSRGAKIRNGHVTASGFENVSDISFKSIDSIKKRFSEAGIFDGKSFWQVEHEIAWLEEESEIIE